MVATTNQPYAFVNDNPLNATDPLGLLGAGYPRADWKKELSAWKKGIDWHAIAQGLTIVASGAGFALCVAAAAACVLALPVIGSATSVALYFESPGKHSSTGAAKAAGEGLGVGTVGAVCAFMCPSVGGAIAIGVGINAFAGSLQNAVDYATSPGRHTARGFFKAVGSGAVQGGIPWEKILKKASGGD